MSDETKSAGSAIISRAARHFQSLGLRRVEVPEWGEDDDHPLVIFYHPITLAERQAFLREGALSGGSEYAYVASIIAKALDENGVTLFTLEHKHWLLTQAYGPIVERISDALLATNLKPLPPPGKGESKEDAAAKN
jgi:hypothetical protein